MTATPNQKTSGPPLGWRAGSTSKIGLWSLAYGYHRDRTPSYGYEPTREAAMAAFAKSWRRE